MSHAVFRGNPTAAQLYLDKIIDVVLEQCTSGNTPNVPRKRDSVLLTEILYYCFKNTPASIFMEILKRSLSIARALIALNARNKHVVMIMRNSEHMAALYYGAMFAGVVPMMLEPSSTVYELQHFIELVDPFTVFCDEERYEDVKEALKETNKEDRSIVVANKAEVINKFIGNHGDDIEFNIVPTSPESTILMLPTSGSTGLPKASHINHQGLVAQLSSLWTYDSQFPSPTRRMLLLSTPQWMTHTIVMSTSPVFQVPLVMTPLKSEPEHILEILQNYQVSVVTEPSWSLFIPSLLPLVAAAARPGQLDCLETLVITGAPLSANSMAIVKEKLSKSAFVCVGYGMTETQSFVAIQTRTTPQHSTGKIFNFLEYKIVDDNEEELGAHKTGELYLRSKYSVFKRYHKNEKAYQESTTSDGWLKTGDLFYRDDEENMFYSSRKKFIIKYFNHQISPEEVEHVIASVPGVLESVVCGTERGAAAAVIVQPGHSVTREQIHRAVGKLSEYKQLRGGVAFVHSLPRTHSGKVLRRECADMLNDLLQKGLCV